MNLIAENLFDQSLRIGRDKELQQVDRDIPHHLDKLKDSLRLILLNRREVRRFGRIVGRHPAILEASSNSVLAVTQGQVNPVGTHGRFAQAT